MFCQSPVETWEALTKPMKKPKKGSKKSKPSKTEDTNFYIVVYASPEVSEEYLKSLKGEDGMANQHTVKKNTKKVTKTATKRSSKKGGTKVPAKKGATTKKPVGTKKGY